jgi:urease accessory protein
MPLTRAVEIVPAAAWPGHPFADHVALTYDERHRRRMRYVAERGTAFLLDLPRAAVLRAGDALRLEDGRMIRIEAAPEALLEVTAPDGHTLIRLAWHIGNRHLPAQLERRRLLIREDPVIAEMLLGLGATVVPVLEPFSPEAGAYEVHAREHAHRHPHGHLHETGGP